MGTVAGGASTAPLRMSNSAKWAGHVTTVFASSPSASEQSSCVHVSSNAWKVPPTFATATGRLSISTLIIWPGWMLSAFATVTNRGIWLSFPLSAIVGESGRRCGSARGALRAARRRRRGARSSVLVVPARDFLAGREPDAALPAHVRDELLDQRHPRRPPADERVARQHEAAVLLVHRDEFLAPHLQHAAGIGDGIGRAVHVAKQRRVVHDPLHRNLGERPFGRGHVVGYVVTHQRAVVAKPVSLQQARRPHVH